MTKSDRLEISKWRNHALEAAANIVKTYVDRASALEAAGSVDDILQLRDKLPGPDGWVTLDVQGKPIDVHPYPEAPEGTPFLWRAYRLGESYMEADA